MKAAYAYIESGRVSVGEMPDPVPGKGQALVRTHSCGLCASEQHFLHAGQNVIDLSPVRRSLCCARLLHGRCAGAM